MTPRHSAVSGYVEGFYGRLLTWGERRDLLRTLAAGGFNTYLYAPKEDPLHRVDWRTPYNAEWREAFREFTRLAATLRINVVAGIAPGLDFNFAELDNRENEENGGNGGNTHDGHQNPNPVNTGSDLHTLFQKCRQLTADGAGSIALLLDDIAADFDLRAGDFTREGTAHAWLANHLGTMLSEQPQPARLMCVPRIYANELDANQAGQESDLSMPDFSGTADAQENNTGVEKPDSTPMSRDYLQHFTDELDPSISWVYCGRHVVSASPDISHCTEAGANIEHHIVLWDNFFANDYCPRRLFLGPWTGRRTKQDLLVNGTGHPCTDTLLLQIVAAWNDNDPDTVSRQKWKRCLTDAGVPEDFFVLQHYFSAPVFSEAQQSSTPTAQSDTPDLARELEAIDSLLWRWQTPLAREWYPYLFGLKHDLMIASGTMPLSRVRKTQSPALARVLEQRMFTQPSDPDDVNPTKA